VDDSWGCLPHTAAVASAHGTAACSLTSCSFSSLAASIAERLAAAAVAGALSKVSDAILEAKSLSLRREEEVGWFGGVGG